MFISAHCYIGDGNGFPLCVVIIACAGSVTGSHTNPDIADTGTCLYPHIVRQHRSGLLFFIHPHRFRCRVFSLLVLHRCGHTVINDERVTIHAIRSFIHFQPDLSYHVYIRTLRTRFAADSPLSWGPSVPLRAIHTRFAEGPRSACACVRVRVHTAVVVLCYRTSNGRQ